MTAAPPPTKQNSSLDVGKTDFLIAYILYYRQGNNPHSQQKHFHLKEKDIKKVVERVKRHCEVMNYRFVNVRPFWSDLDREENILFQKEDEG